MSSINLRKELKGSFEELLDRLTRALQAQGFGVLTRIDFHSKMKEKLGKELPPTVILGACNPQLAFEAYSRNAEVTALLPCNAVLKQLADGKVAVELARPSELMRALGDEELVRLASEADARLARVLEAL
jgi:uncharacterized protein (DUF302 family)